MWLHKFISKYKLYWAENYYLPEQTNLRYLAICKSLDSRLFENFSIHNACLFKVKVLYSNLNEYINKLKFINEHLQENNYISNNWCKYDFQEIALSEFFVENNGNMVFYSNPVVAVEEFKKQYLIYCQLILSIETSAVGKEEHNFRILTEFNSHLNSVVLFLLRYVYAF